MRLLDNTDNFEKDFELRMLDGNICRICVSDDPLEIARMVGFACDRINMLAQYRMLQLQEKKVNKTHVN